MLATRCMDDQVIVTGPGSKLYGMGAVGVADDNPSTFPSGESPRVYAQAPDCRNTWTSLHDSYDIVDYLVAGTITRHLHDGSFIDPFIYDSSCTFFLTSSGDLYRVGKWALNNPPPADYGYVSTPTLVATGVTGMMQLRNYGGTSAPFLYIFWLKEGNLWGMGFNDTGDADSITVTNNTVSHGTPFQYTTTGDIVKMTCSMTALYFIRADGRMYAQGNNKLNMLGLINTQYYNPVWVTPQELFPGTLWKDVDMNWDVAVGIRTDGTLWKWGRATGMVNTPQYTPHQVGSATNWEKVFNGDHRVSSPVETSLRVINTANEAYNLGKSFIHGYHSAPTRIHPTLNIRSFKCNSGRLIIGATQDLGNVSIFQTVDGRLYGEGADRGVGSLGNSMSYTPNLNAIPEATPKLLDPGPVRDFNPNVKSIGDAHLTLVIK